MGGKIDLTGHKYGMLTVLYEVDPQVLKSGHKNYVWKCLCDCGNEKNVRATSLRSGVTVSCGCYHKKVASQCDSPKKIARREYERIYGALPKGYKVTALDGNFKNTSPENLYATTRNHLQRVKRNGIASKGNPDIKRIALDLCKLNDLIVGTENRL